MTTDELQKNLLLAYVNSLAGTDGWSKNTETLRTRWPLWSTPARVNDKLIFEKTEYRKELATPEWRTGNLEITITKYTLLQQEVLDENRNYQLQYDNRDAKTTPLEIPAIAYELWIEAKQGQHTELCAEGEEIARLFDSVVEKIR